MTNGKLASGAFGLFPERVDSAQIEVQAVGQRSLRRRKVRIPSKRSFIHAGLSMGDGKEDKHRCIEVAQPVTINVCNLPISFKETADCVQLIPDAETDWRRLRQQ